MSDMTNREVLLSLRNVEISFDNGGKEKFKAVQDANFDIYKGETFALVGESGSGKTTIGRAIMRINPLSNGEITFEGNRISGKLSKQEDMNVIRNIQMIFQDPDWKRSAFFRSTNHGIRTSSPAASGSVLALPGP